MSKSIIVCAILMFSASGHTACPIADLSGDCFVGIADLAVMASQWMTEGVRDIVFVDIPSGTFQMGDSFNEEGSDERPVHTITLSSFKMSKYEITNGQYAAFLDDAFEEGEIRVDSNVVYDVHDIAHDYAFFDTYAADLDSQIDYSSGNFTVRSKGGRSMANYPVVEVSWHGAKAFCDYYGYRLPTEAQWEYAARGGLSGRRFPWGYTITHDWANYYSSVSYFYDTSSTRGYHPTWNDGIYPYTSPVGRFPANGYGLYDMAGNAWEWCNDWHSSSYYSTSPSINPTGPTSGSSRVIRGASWDSDAYNCRVANRTYDPPSFRSNTLGFRVCLD